mmetsp:Transcript_31154/g.103085  ORF Transcript_31154/g.103085 Transcript_31154/m.103085 type:complete len:223 (+) Transcript_31154:286-954(+)
MDPKTKRAHTAKARAFAHAGRSPRQQRRERAAPQTMKTDTSTWCPKALIPTFTAAASATSASAGVASCATASGVGAAPRAAEKGASCCSAPSAAATAGSASTLCAPSSKRSPALERTHQPSASALEAGAASGSVSTVATSPPRIPATEVSSPRYEPSGSRSHRSRHGGLSTAATAAAAAPRSAAQRPRSSLMERPQSSGTSSCILRQRMICAPDPSPTATVY